MSDTEVVAATATEARQHPNPAPHLADGIELIGEFAGSGFKQPPFIARRSDGQVVQMPRLLYRLAEQIDGRAGYPEIADRYSQAIQRRVGEVDARMLVEQRLRPLGIVAPEDGGATVKLDKIDPLLALKFRAAVVPDHVVRPLTAVFRPLFYPPVMVLAVLALLGVDIWLFFVHGISQSLRHTLDQPALMLVLITGVVLATAFHEVGHATACRYGGARPGVMGVGIYIVWPAFYTDITDAYRLGRWGRLRADIGGMYFNGLFAVAVTALYGATSFEPLLLLVVLQNVAIMQQALPLLRLDGYYILSDLTGVPDIFVRLRPILTSLLPRRPADRRVTELKPWVRVVVSAYVVLVVLFLTVTGLAVVINLPRILATAYSSASAHFSGVGPALDRGSVARAVLDAIQGLFLILPGIGLLYTLARVAQRVAVSVARWSSGQPRRRAALGVAAIAGVALALLSWWPNGEYRAIQPGERGTVPGLFGQVAQLPSARPSLTARRARQLGLPPTGTPPGARGARKVLPAGGTLGARLKLHHRTGTSMTTPAATGAGAAGTSGPSSALPAGTSGPSSALPAGTSGPSSARSASAGTGQTANAPASSTAPAPSPGTTTPASAASSRTTTAPAGPAPTTTTAPATTTTTRATTTPTTTTSTGASSSAPPTGTPSSGTGTTTSSGAP